MKSIFLFLFFSAFCFTASAQYGRLEPLRDWDTVNVVMRTPKETIIKLLASTDKAVKKQGTLIQSIEKQLEIVRSGFLVNKIPTTNTAYFIRSIEDIQKLGVDPNYYIREFFIYYPRPHQRQVGYGQYQ